MDKSENDRLASFRNFCKVHFRTIALFAFSIAVVSELGGIWHEIRLMRNEQVKNAAYSWPEKRRSSLNETLKRRLESTTYVQGSVEIDGDVKLDQPVEVEIEP